MIFNKQWGLSVLLLITLLFPLFHAASAHGRNDVFFDNEAVFCMYFKMSEEEVADQDIEELLIALGRPAFSDYKPSELFTRKTVRQKRAELDKNIRRLSEPTTLKWRFECLPSKLRSGFSTYYLMKNLPFATPYIRSNISKKDLLAVIKQLRQVSKTARFKFNEKVRIDIHLRPVKYENRTQERTIALQKTVFPVRFVVFEPLKVEVIQQSGTRPVETDIRRFRAMLSR